MLPTFRFTLECPRYECKKKKKSNQNKSHFFILLVKLHVRDPRHLPLMCVLYVVLCVSFYTQDWKSRKPKLQIHHHTHLLKITKFSSKKRINSLFSPSQMRKIKQKQDSYRSVTTNAWSEWSCTLGSWEPLFFFSSKKHVKVLGCETSYKPSSSSSSWMESIEDGVWRNVQSSHSSVYVPNPYPSSFPFVQFFMAPAFRVRSIVLDNVPLCGQLAVSFSLRRDTASVSWSHGSPTFLKLRILGVTLSKKKKYCLQVLRKSCA